MRNNIRWEGTAMAVSSVLQGAETLGTVTYLRRERFLLPDNTVEDIPVISGNSWRGLLRRTVADLWWEAAGEPIMTMAVMHAIWAGGALAKSTGQPLTGSRAQTLKSACLPVGLFGAAGGGRILDGCVQVGKMVPLCEETRHVIPEKYITESMPSIWDLTQIEYYSKVPNTDMERVENNEEEQFLPMRFGIETFIPGTVFYTWLNLSWPTDDELSLMREGLQHYLGNAKVGGMSRAGHGNLSFDLEEPEILQDFVSSDWRESIPEVTELRKILSWLD